MVSIGQLSEYAKSGPPTAVKGIVRCRWCFVCAKVVCAKH